ncbi:hypothetical protein SS50377_23708 [Spironucleus salmonicida]|uniref:Uncharacterized protein n=1 Tax=Spironucleus salmonicida TaxID=348837 RepID=V6LVV0_9EUKA|nr:hypothetical protein SS50377_23708 [Spironucleus salmonicida]|eukprot:EST48690.1 hypothetical protein SS50377_11303 [Spironucleus salmonicida]
MSILESKIETPEQFKEIKLVIQDHLLIQDQKSELYKHHIIGKLITFASSTEVVDIQIEVLETIDLFLQDSSDLILVSQSSILYLCMILLKNSNPLLQIASLKLLTSLCQYDENATALLQNHHLIKNIVLLAEQIMSQDITEDITLLIQHFTTFMYICCSVSTKVQKKLSQAGISDFLLNATEKLQDTTQPLASTLAILQMLSQEKFIAQAVMQRNYHEFLLKMLQKYLDNQTNIEICQLVLNLIGTICAVFSASVAQFMQVKIPSMIYCIILDTKDINLLRFAVSALVEILYADKGYKYQNLTVNLRQIGQIDDLLQNLIDLPDKFEDDSECYTVWAIMMRMLASVPKKEDHVRQSILCRGVLKRLLVGLTSDVSLNAKISLLDALGQMFCRQQLPPQVYLDDLAKTTSVVLKLKREFVSFKNQKSAEKLLYLEAVERAKTVLERLGHQEGRNTTKYTMYSMFIMGCTLLVGAGISFLVRGVN